MSAKALFWSSLVMGIAFVGCAETLDLDGLVFDGNVASTGGASAGGNGGQGGTTATGGAGGSTTSGGGSGGTGGSGGMGGAPSGGGGVGGMPAVALALSNHSQGQLEDEFTGASMQDAVLFAFRLTPQSGSAEVTQVDLTLRDFTGMTSNDFSNPSLWQDNGNRALDGGDVLASTGTVSGNSLLFSQLFTVSAATDYIVSVDVANLVGGDSVTLTLTAQNVTARVAPNGPTISVSGSAGDAQHTR